jgi:hypothetical protein
VTGYRLDDLEVRDLSFGSNKIFLILHIIWSLKMETIRSFET